MSFFVVPSVSYQTQQKLKAHKEKKKAKEKKKDVEKEVKKEERRQESDASSIMSKRKKKPGWGLLHRTSTSSKVSADMRDDGEYEEDAKSMMSGYPTNPPMLPSDPEINSDAEDWESLYSDQISKSKSFTNLPKARSEEPETKHFNLDEVLSEDESNPKNKDSASQSKSSEQTPDFGSISSSSQKNVAHSSFLSGASQRPTARSEQAERDEEMPSLIANNYGKTMRAETFKPLNQQRQQSIHTGLAVSPKTPSTPTISPLTPAIPVAPFHASSPHSTSSSRPRVNSAFTTTSAPSGPAQQRYPSNAAFHRNSSLSSNNTTQSQPVLGSKEPTSKFKKLHFLTGSTKKKGSSKSLPSSPGANSPQQSPGSSKQTDSYFPDVSNQPTNAVIPSFHAVLDLSVLNSYDGIKQNLLNPPYQVFRYNNFLSLMSEYHSSDAIHFAKIRNQSLLKFIVRHKRAKEVVDKRGYFDQENYRDLHNTECILAYFLYHEIRTDLRRMIKFASKNHQWANHEELIHTNFVNYIRYLVLLPEIDNLDDLSDEFRRHYKNKQVFSVIANSLYALKHDISSDVSNENNKATKAKLLIECVTKVSYEYILLEKYRFDMTSKFYANHLIARRPLMELFGLYKNNIAQNNKENVKVLLFNSSNSIQYGWYLAISVPFVRFVETSIYAEDMGALQDYNVYQKQEDATIKTNFTISDHELYDNSISKLKLTTFQEYNSMSMESLVALSKKTDNDSSNYAHLKREEVPDPSSAFSYRPMNFEYYSQSIATIPSNSFNLVQTTDLPYEIKRENYKTILHEFHRILKPGGSLVTDSIHFGSKSTHEFLHEHVKGNFPRAWNYFDFSVSQHFEVIPNFVETILLELNTIFGRGNVKFGINLLSSSSEVNYFLAKFGGLKLFEMIGKLGEYCNYFEDGDTVKSQHESSVHFCVHIEAIKRA
ncbi:hypothetical protein CANMA_000779 [Candida margitis]|uniref:uncharacterized protein n=1 Tax=Candida margitis TaxID=1775924 RepID=UPI00222625B5|nr:uncharacterized protein CANMA_000779 [Candida margitis]KAI5970168.1 hypothetical protein CANMA_000779 [Candida margitis]